MLRTTKTKLLTGEWECMGFGEQDFIGEQVWLTELLAGGKVKLCCSAAPKSLPHRPPALASLLVSGRCGPSGKLGTASESVIRCHERAEWRGQTALEPKLAHAENRK